MKWGDYMAMTILDEQLKIGQVKSVTSDFGRYIDYVELLFSPTTKVQFRPSENKANIVFAVSDNNLDLPEMVCELTRDTVRNLIVSLKNVYNELIVEPDDETADKDGAVNDQADKDDKPCGICAQKRRHLI